MEKKIDKRTTEYKESQKKVTIKVLHMRDIVPVMNAPEVKQKSHLEMIEDLQGWVESLSKDIHDLRSRTEQLETKVG